MQGRLSQDGVDRQHQIEAVQDAMYAQDMVSKPLPRYLGHSHILHLVEDLERGEDQAWSWQDGATPSATCTEKVNSTNSAVSHRLDLRMASERTRKSITFSEFVEGRGMRLGLLLRCFGSVLCESGGTEATFCLSQPVDVLHAFISHNWSVNRIDKFVALSLYFNLHLAVAYLILVLALAAAIVGTGHNPGLVMMCLPWIDGRGIESITCTVLYVGVFAAVFFGRELLRLLHLDQTVVFLDKTCIDQQSSTSKQNGIECLGAFIHRSERMIVPCTSLYFDRLWTMYEMATFLMLHPRQRLVLLPIAMARCTLIQAITWYFLCVISLGEKIWIRSQEHSTSCRFQLWDVTAQFTVVMLLQVFIVAHTRGWLLQVREIEEKIRSFSIASATCHVDSDRQFVLGNIAAFARDMQLVSAESSEAEAQEAFETYVRQEMPSAAAKCCGRFGLPYRYQVFVYAPMLMVGIDHLCIPGKPDWLFFLTSIYMTFVVLPLLHVLCVYLLKLALRMRGPASYDCWLTLLLTTALVTIIGTFSFVALCKLRVHVVSGVVVATISYTAIMAVGSGIAWLVFRPEKWVEALG